MPVLRSLAIAAVALCAPAAFGHETVSGYQKKAVEEFLAAVATGNPQSVAYAIHPNELEALRTRLLTKLRDEAKRGESTIRDRLFGSAMPLTEIERLTMITFYSTLGRKLQLSGRLYDDFRYVGAIPESDDRAQIVVHARVPRERGTTDKVDVVHVVTIKRYGKDWKAAVPSEIEAQIDDLMHARRRVAAAQPAQGPTPGGAAGAGTGDAGGSIAPASVRERLVAAEKALTDSKCEEYYKEHMSPNFRRVISKKALEALISSCQNSIGNREMLLSTVRIVRGLEPRFEYNAKRVVYDVSGHGLPFDKFALEYVDRDKNWFIAE
ncbi:MAG: hypothetical protein ACT4O5_01100 [Gammaproteobacteria bacterium]